MNPAGISSCSTPRKKLEYIWDYYHWHMIIVLVLVLSAVFITKDLRSREAHNIGIPFVSQYSYPDLTCEEQAEKFSALAEESLGHKTDIGINQILLPDSVSKTYLDAALQTQLLIELSVGEGSLMLLDAHALSVIREYSEEYFSCVIEVPRAAVIGEIQQELYLAQKAERPDTELLQEETKLFSALQDAFKALQAD